MNNQASLFDEKDIIFSYSRAQAIKDRVLIDVSREAREQGVLLPVAITRAVWDKYIVPEENSKLHCKSIMGRLADTLLFYKYAAKDYKGSNLNFSASYVFKDNEIRRIKLKAICGPGDTAAPVVTIMLPEED